MPRHRAQRRARGELAGNVLLECREHGRLADRDAAVEALVEPRKQPRVLISGAADHDAIDVRKLRHAVLERHEAAD
jgi:hypothetical protein